MFRKRISNCLVSEAARFRLEQLGERDRGSGLLDGNRNVEDIDVLDSVRIDRDGESVERAVHCPVGRLPYAHASQGTRAKPTATKLTMKGPTGLCRLRRLLPRATEIFEGFINTREVDSFAIVGHDDLLNAAQRAIVQPHIDSRWLGVKGVPDKLRQTHMRMTP